MISRPTRAALFALATVALAPRAVHAEPVFAAYRMLQPTGAAGGTDAPAIPTLADVTGPARPITLPELLQMAARQAPDLQRATVDIAVAEAQIEASLGIDDYNVEAQISGSTDTENHTLEAFAQINRVLSGGTSVGLRVDSSWSRNLRTDTFDPDNNPMTMNSVDVVIDERGFRDSISATITQPLLEGRGRDIVRAQERQARIARSSAVLQRRSAAISVVRDVITAYWDLALAQRDLDIRRSSLDLAHERLRRTQAAIRGGGIAATEALAVEQVIATREEEVLAAELRVVDQSIAVRRLVGMEIGPNELALATAGDLGAPGEAWNLDQLVADANRQSPELALLAEQTKSATIEVEVTENGLLPSLDLSFTIGPLGQDDTFGGAVKNMVTVDDVQILGSLTYQHSIGNRAARGEARRARVERERIRIDEFDARQQIARGLAEAVVLAESAARRVQIAERAVKLAEQNIAAEQSRFGLGKATNFDVLQRQDELKQAQLRQASAIVDWHKAAAVIVAIRGDLLEQYGVALPD